MKSALIASIFWTLAWPVSVVLGQDFTEARVLGEVVLPTGFKVDETEFGGISGLDYDPAANLYYAISDDRSEKAPARFYTLKIIADEKGVHRVDIVSTTTLLDANGKPFAAKDVDPESIRFNASTGTIYWTSEGDLNGRPAIRESRIDGGLIREFDLPRYYIPDAPQTQGTRNNLSFESLAISTDGRTLLAGTENALMQDGDKATLETGSRSRIIAFDIPSGAVKAEYAYDTDPIFAKATRLPFWNDNGLSEFSDWNGDLLTVERAYAHGVGNQISFYRASLANATDVKGKEALKGAPVTPVKKERVLRIGEGDFGLDIDNIESITWGPIIGGRKTIIIASDNNFNPSQFTQFVVIQLGADKE